jgi:hypothetical protein
MSGNTRGQAFFYFGADTDDFKKAFSEYGAVIVLPKYLRQDKPKNMD